MSRARLTVRSFLSAFIRDENGVAVMEFALVSGIILVPTLIGIIEVSRYVQMSEKLDDAAANLLNAINQNYTVNDAQLSYFANAVPTMVAPFDADGWTAIITAVNKGSKTSCPLYALWQSTKSDPNFSTNSKSQIAGGNGSKATIPGLPDLDPNDQVLTVEIYLQYRPIIDTPWVRRLIGLSSKGMYRMAVARPRYGSFMKDPLTGNDLTPPC